MRTIRTLTAALLATVGLVVVGSTTQSAQAVVDPSKALNVRTTKAIAHENVLVSGRTYGNIARSVRLQYKSGSKWKTLTSVTTTAGGSFSLTINPTKTRSYRYYAPKVGSAKAVTGTARKITVVKQKVEVFAIANSLQCSLYDPEPISVIVKFSPARPGRAVTLYAYGITLYGTQELDGSQAFTIYPPAHDQETYLVTARTEESNGAAHLMTKSLPYQVSEDHCL